ncbi:tetratricopeptide repeat protein [Pseudofrankia sp. BMG5.37]|uniref:tetratricopeptide repeat protein n=1 Tax=Pseudofrankia sp. BMG5.37 TaxID=3050035 RepID=UPI002893FD26|nr:tetratricopeptide repeat protein [Pseudofrankia sp. BMG5.37]MDT3445396.1 tetratricopeptide repeat protein [Pseudofrankia sp. BMG5.37]
MSDVGRPWRVFLSHTGDMRHWPATRSWVAAAEDAVKRLRHAPVDMLYFTADDRPPADLCTSLVAGCDLYVGIIGLRYGSPVRDDPDRSYTELEFDTATELGKRRLVFLVDPAALVGAPTADVDAAGAAADPWADRQERFRRRLLDSGLTAPAVATPANLETALVQAIAQLMLADAVDARMAAADAAGRSAHATRRVPRQLPPEAAAFTDRVRHFERLAAHLERPDRNRAFVGLVGGPAGVGKTSFAVHVAHRVRDRFPDGQLYVDLRGYSPLPALRPEEALDGFVRALGLEPEQVPTDLAGLVQAYRTLLDNRRALLIIDNALTSEQVRPLLPPPGSAAIVTTRGPLSGLVVQDGALRMVLEPLEPVHAETLLRALAAGAAGDPFFDPEAGGGRAASPGDSSPAEDPVAELARQCGYLPLALRIAAEQAVLTGLSLADLVDELASERGRLDVLTGIDDDPGTQVRTVFYWSYRNLPNDQRRAFRLLAAHPGSGVSVPAAAALLGQSPAATARVLDTLVAFNMLERPARGRYRFHDLIGAYAAERLEEDEPEADRAAALDRLLDWYLHAADAADRIIAPLRRHVPLGDPAAGTPPVRLGGNQDAVRWYDEERHNIAALVRLAASTGRHETAWKLALAPVPYLTLRHHYTDWLQAVELGAAAAEAAGDASARAWCVMSVGGASMTLGRPDPAYAAHQTSVRLNREIGDRVGEGMALSNLGETAYLLGRLDEALDVGHQALAIWRELDDPRDLAITLRDVIAPVHLARGEHEEALRIYQEALETSRGLDKLTEGLVLHDLGRTYQAMGNQQEAFASYDSAARTRRASGDLVGEADSLRGLASAQLALGDAAGAQGALLQALAILVEQGRDQPADEVRAALRGLGFDPDASDPAHGDNGSP